MNKARTIGHIMIWGSIAAMILTMFSIEPLHLSHEITTVIMLLFFIILGLSHSYLNAGISEIKDDYLIIKTGIGSHLKYKIYFHEINNIEVVYGWYDADIKITFKNKDNADENKMTKYHIVDWESFWRFRIPVTGLPGNRIEEWLFPLLNKLYDKCVLSVKQKKFFLDIAIINPLKPWDPPGEIKYNDQKLVNNRRNILPYVIIGIVIGLAIITAIISIVNARAQ